MIGCAVSAQMRLPARVSRVPCPTHGIVQVHVPWAAPGSQFTAHIAALGRDTAHHAARRHLRFGDVVAGRLGIELHPRFLRVKRVVARGGERTMTGERKCRGTR
jgi:hypothetical protein